MCLPWNHKWETKDNQEIEVYDDRYKFPTSTKYIIIQRCTHCGKEIVRKYRV